MSTDLEHAGLSSDRRDLAATAQAYLGEHPDDPLAGVELGWFGIGIDEASGGSGGSFADLAPVIEAAGARSAATAVLWTTGVLGRLLSAGGGAAAEEWLPRIAEGAATVALPLADPAVAARVVETGGELVVHGAPEPTAVLLPVGARLALVPAEGMRLRPVPGVDASRFLHRLAVDASDPDADGVTWLAGPVSPERLRAAVARVAALDAVGAARSALGATLDYARQRHQFGRPIGSFQAYKHRCATAFQLFKLAQSGAFRAAADDVPDSPSTGTSDGTAEADTLALAAALEGTRACTFVCGDAVQLHGAIGFSWETGLHAHLRRSRSAEIIAAAGEELVEALLAGHRSAT